MITRGSLPSVGEVVNGWTVLAVRPRQCLARCPKCPNELWKKPHRLLDSGQCRACYLTEAAKPSPAPAFRKVTAYERARPLTTGKRQPRLSAAERAELAEIEAELAEIKRPTTRGDCANGPRPCPWVSCKYHLYLDVNPRTGTIKLNFPESEVWDLKRSCALDVIDHGTPGNIQEGTDATLLEIGLALNLTRERIRQVEEDALGKLKANLNGHAAEVRALLPDLPAWEPK